MIPANDNHTDRSAARCVVNMILPAVCLWAWIAVTVAWLID